MATVTTHGRTEETMKEATCSTRRKDTAYTPGQTDVSTMASGRTASKTGMATTNTPKTRTKKSATGNKARGSSG